jgi:hypothetical protein
LVIGGNWQPNGSGDADDAAANGWIASQNGEYSGTGLAG